MKIKYAFFAILSLLVLACPQAKKTTVSIWSEQWMGIYIRQAKIGYSFSRIQKSDSHYKLLNRMKINLTMMGQPEQVISEFSGITDINFALQKFDFDFQSMNRKFLATGEIKENQLTIEVKSGGQNRKEKRELTEPVYPAMMLGKIALQQNFKSGRNYSVKVFDATILAVVDAKIKILEKEKINIDDTEYNLRKIEITMLDLTTIIWVDDNGITRKETSPPGLISIEENRNKALAVEELEDKIDILTLFSVSADTIIPEPRMVKRLKLELSNIEEADVNLSDDFQKIIQTNPLIIENKVTDSIPVVMLPIKSHFDYQKPSLYIQSDNAEIKRTVTKIIGKEKQATIACEKILRWVYNNLTKRSTASLPSALDVLQNMEGDCNEHAILFTALCRAVGIPTQICVGLVYVDGRFYYHAWNKVYLKQWIAVDPTFNQYPCDATHIKFAEGELQEQAKVLKIVGEIKMKILEFN